MSSLRSLGSFRPLALFLLLLLPAVAAQRPSSASTCDYYAIQRFGANTSETQFRLIQDIVVLAFGGGGDLANASDVTGILNPGRFDDEDIDLRPYFNGSIASTNLNNQPIGINWLDDGGIEPLNEFLAGSTANLTLEAKSNQDRLFDHFFMSFSRSFGCTMRYAPANSTSHAQLGLAYIHKYMELKYNQLGYFIDQFAKASQVYGFSQQDAKTFSDSLNARFNVRCAPPVNNMLLSLCQDESCPLAAPEPDCDSYVDLQPNALAVQNDTASGPTTTANPVTATGTPMASAGGSSGDGGSSSLSGGAIAGIVIGAVVLFLLGLGLILFLLRKRKNRDTPATAAASAPGQSTGNPSFYGASTYVPSSYGAPSVAGGPQSPQMRHESWVDSQMYKSPGSPPPIHEMEFSPQQGPMQPPPVEMESPRFELDDGSRR